MLFWTPSKQFVGGFDHSQRSQQQFDPQQHCLFLLLQRDLLGHSPLESLGPNRSGLSINVSLVVEFQRWWVLKSKIFAQESTCSKEILVPTTLNYLWSSVVGVVKVDYFYFPCEVFEILCELDVRVIASTF